MIRWRDWPFFLATVFAAVLGLQNAGDCEDVDQDFYATVQQHFSEWDLNHDGVLSGAEIDKAFKNPKYTGPAAAAINV